jgi:peptidoglycan/xylan/chitin deacetylase (PgdA/CDA1 family)
MGHVQLPQGKRIAVNLGTDFDAQCLWLGAFNKPSPSYMSRGEFGAEVGTPRLLELYDRFDVKTSWFTPGHTVDTFPDACKRIRDAGHEFGNHGYYHENPTKISRETEERLIDLAMQTFDKQLGLRPTGYRSPYWDYSDSTLGLVEKFGFKYDSSLMGRDLVPYRPRRWQVRWEQGNVAGKASHVLEIPVSWYLDDFPPLAYVTGIQAGMQEPRRSTAVGRTSSTTATSGSTIPSSSRASTRRSLARRTTCCGTSASSNTSRPRTASGSPPAIRSPTRGSTTRATRR